MECNPVQEDAKRVESPVGRQDCRGASGRSRIPSQQEIDECRMEPLALIDLPEALEAWRAGAASPGVDAGRSLRKAVRWIELLPIEGPRRWDFLATQRGYWLPDPQLVSRSNHSW